MNIQLTVGQQTAAAKHVEDSIADLEKLLTALSGNIESAVPGMMATAVHNYGEEAHDIEVKNVAIVG